jgi:cyclopropane-fatty-acyl-phospholipid synthase
MLLQLAQRGLAPDAVIRFGIRRRLRNRLRKELAAAPRTPAERLAELRRQFARGPISDSVDEARRNRSEAPVEFFQAMLGPRLKFSCCLWDDGVETLAAAEDAMLAAMAQRAEIVDGQRVLDLSCGWGSFALWAGERFPRADIVAVSHFSAQHKYITAEARRRGLANVRHLLADVSSQAFANDLTRVTPAHGSDGDERVFDRIVTAGIFEHLHNAERLFHQLRDWIAPGGRMLVQMPCHRELFYQVGDLPPGQWLTQNFFVPVAIPPLDLFEHVHGPFVLVKRWEIDASHYVRTWRAWLQNLDRARGVILDQFAQDMSRADARRKLQRWRIFLMSCGELFAFDAGRQWFATHHLLAPR